jgi:hypothetical protein
MGYYPDREAYLSDMGDACGRAEENVVNSFLEGIEKSLEDLRYLLSEKDYKIVRSRFEIDFPIRKEILNNK